jgi:hypothetical protein
MYLFLMAYLLVELWAESQVMYLLCGQGRAQLVWWEYPRRRCRVQYIFVQRTDNANLFLQRLLLVHTPPRLRFSSDKNMEWLGKRNLTDVGEKFLMGAWEGAVASPG